jgi:hypothetical protein
MAQTTELTRYQDIPCCPNLDTAPVCDFIDMRRRLLFPTEVRTESGQAVNVEVIIHSRFERCSGPLALGEPVYTTTLLPGEKVRLATSDRRSRFSFDSETKLSYRSEQLSEEQYRMASLRAFMSDQNSTDNGSSRSTDQGSWDFHGDASGSIGFLSASADANAHGSHNAQSTFEYLNQHSAHARMSDNLSVEATRKAHSVSVGEVSTRTHQQGESEDHFESSSQEFSNPNHCHAITFIFYRLNKIETIKFEIVAIERRVLDPVAPVPVLANPIRNIGKIATVPQEVPATNSGRIEIETRGLQSEQLYAQAATPGFRFAVASSFQQVQQAVPQPPISEATRKAALEDVDRQLASRGLIDPNTGQVSAQTVAEFGFQRRTALPTAGIIVKGCLDDCDVCEPELKQRTQLEIENLALKNRLLERQIELLEKSQEYRCCPAGEVEEASPHPNPPP